MCKICSNKFGVKCLEQSNKAFSAENVTDLMKYEYCCLCQGIFKYMQLVDASVVILKKYFPEIEMRQLEDNKYKSNDRCRQNLQDFRAFSIKCTNSTRKIQEFCSIFDIMPQGGNLYEVYQFLYNLSTVANAKNVLTSAIQLKDEEINTIKGRLLQYNFPTKTEVYKKYLFETKWKDCLRKYLLVDKNLSDTEIFKRELCPFETKHNCSKMQHLLRHKNPTKVTMFKCEKYNDKTKFRNDLKRHILIHKSPTEIELFSELCRFGTKYNDKIRHFSICKDSTEATMFKCEICNYKIKFKNFLKRHFLIHKRPTTIEMVNCKLCRYETNQKSSLKPHTSLHKNSEGKMFECDKCSSEMKFKNLLNKHFLIHEGPPKMEMFNCELYPFETKREGSKMQYLLRHEIPTGVTMFKCKKCNNYKTKFRHFFIHKSPTEIEIFSCELCLFERKCKDNLKQPSLIKNPR